VAVPFEVCAKLAWFSMQRLNHRLRLKFVRPARQPRSQIKELFAATALQTREAIVAHFSRRSHPNYLWDDTDLARLKAVALSHVPEEVERIKAKAEKIRDGVFPLVSDIEFSFPSQVVWQFPFDDLEHLFFLNRWYHGVTLAKAFFYTGDESHVQCFATLLESWIENNPVNTSSPVWESYSATERIVNWIFAYHLLKDSEVFQQRSLIMLLSSLSAHASYLREHLELKENHNHLINNARALFTVGLLFPELNDCADLAAEGWRILTRELKRQFLGDGMLGEQSVHYHLLLLRTYIEVTILAERNQRRIDKDYREQLERLFRCADAFIRPDGSIPMIGDFSPDTDLRSLTGIFAAGTNRFKLDMGGPLSECGLWYEDLSLVRASGSNPRRELIQLPESGYAIVRTPDLHLTFGCDPRAQVIRHGHADVLGLNVWYRGCDILTDGGNYSYSKRQWDQYFRGPYGHNTVVIDGLSPYILPGYQQVLLPAEYARARASLEAAAVDAKTFYLSGHHSGYARLSQPASVQRQVWVAVNDWILIRDTISGKGQRRVEVVYNFGKCEFENGLLSSPRGEKLALIETRCDQSFSQEHTRGGIDPQIRGWISPSYAKKEPANMVSSIVSAAGDLVFETLIWLHPDAAVVWPEPPPVRVN
jgi:hypothetical protein